MYPRPSPIREMLIREINEAKKLIEEVKLKFKDLPEILPETKTPQK